MNGAVSAATEDRDDARAQRLRDAFGLLSRSDFAALVGIDERTADTWRAQGKGPDVVRVGRSIFYRRRDVEAFIDMNVVLMDRVA